MQLPPIDHLLLLGVHNSYEASRQVTPDQQVDAYGAWAVELDFGFESDGQAVIGHDAAGQGSNGSTSPHVFLQTCAGSYYLRDYLRALRDTEASAYRPLLIYLDFKGWGASPVGAEWEDAIGGVLHAVFGGRLLTPTRFHDVFGDTPPMPSVRDLAGYVLAIATNSWPGSESVFAPGHPFLELGISGPCGAPMRKVQPPVGSAFFVPIPPRTIDGPDALHVIRIDNFTDEWTFDFGAPANPLIVNPAASAQTLVPTCADESSPAHLIAPQGTRLLPFPTLSDAVSRAALKGRYRANATDRFTEFIMGAGYTVLMAPGTYRGPVRIDFPLYLRSDNGTKSAL